MFPAHARNMHASCKVQAEVFYNNVIVGLPLVGYFDSHVMSRKYTSFNIFLAIVAIPTIDEVFQFMESEGSHNILLLFLFTCDSDATMCEHSIWSTTIADADKN